MLPSFPTRRSSDLGGFGERPRPSDGVLPRSRPRIPRGHGAGGGRRDRDRQGDRVPRALHVIAFVTTNEGKYREVSAILADAGVKIVREDRSYPEIQADRLEKVVRFAATVLDDQIRGDYLIDDSGLFLDAFGGFPGVYSSYVHKRLGNPGLLKLLQDAKTRAATFETVFLLRQGGSHEVFHGECRGTIADRKSTRLNSSH